MTTPPPSGSLRDRIAQALANADGLELGETESFPFLHENQVAGYRRRADAVLAVLPEPTDRAAALREAADELGRMDYDTDSNDYGYDTYRDAWNGGVMDGADLLRRMADEAPEGKESA